jgi:hypothetical protein
VETRTLSALIALASMEDGGRTGEGLRMLREMLARDAVPPSAGTCIA